MFHDIFIQPLFNLLVFFYNLVGRDMGVAIIVLTLVIRLILSPLTIRSQRAQRELAKLNPKIDEIKQKYKNDQAAQGNAIMALYKEHNINPFSGCLPTLLQLPIMIALYQAFLMAFKPESLNELYSFVAHPGSLNSVAFGFSNITTQNPFLAVMTGVFQYVYGLYTIRTQGPVTGAAASMNFPMLYLFPIMVVIITWRFPAGLAVYWIAVTLYSIMEQLYIVRKYK